MAEAVTPELRSAIIKTAGDLGINPLDLATVISYETAGTFDPWKRGPTTKWGTHRGLIQWGEPQARQYGVTKDMPVSAQLEAAGKYLRDRGVRPGMGILDVYSAINAGGVGPEFHSRSDEAAGGAPGTVRDKVANQMGDHRRKAAQLLGRAGRGDGFDPNTFGAVAVNDDGGAAPMAFASEQPQRSPAQQAIGNIVNVQPAELTIAEQQPMQPFDPATVGAVQFDPTELGAVPVKEEGAEAVQEGAITLPADDPAIAPEESGEGEPKDFSLVNGILSAITGGSEAGLMGGFDDEIGAAMIAPVRATINYLGGEGFDLGESYRSLRDEKQAQKEKRREQYPVTSLAGEVMGGLALGGSAARHGLTMVGRSLPGVGKTGAAALEGAAYGGVYGAGEAEPGERLEGAATGATVGAVTGAGLERVGRGLANRAARKAAPAAQSSEELSAQARVLYQQADNAGITIKAPAVDKLAARVSGVAGRINKDLRPNTAGIVDDVLSLRGKNVTLQELDELRQVANLSMKRAQPQDERTLLLVKNAIDDFADSLKAGDITGDVGGIQLIKQAREVWSRKAKTEIIEDIVEKAKNQATGFENGLVSQFRALANNKAKMKAFTPAEREMIKKIVRRGSAHGILRALGMMAPNSTFGGLMTGGVGVGAGIIPGAAVAGTGMAARSGAGALTRGKVNNLQQAVSTGQPPAINMLPNRVSPLIPGGVAGTEGVRRSLAQ